MSDTMNETDKKIIAANETDKHKVISIGEIHNLTGINRETIQDRLRHLYTTKKIFPFLNIYHCNACFHADVYGDFPEEDIFCKLLTKCFKNIEHIPKECPLRTQKYYIELFVDDINDNPLVRRISR